MDPTPRRRIVVETASTGDTPSELRLRTRRNDATYLRGTPLPPGVLARGHVVGPLMLADLEAVVSGVTAIIPTSLVIEDGEPRADEAGLPFTAINFDGATIEGTLDVRPSTTPMGAPRLLVDVRLRDPGARATRPTEERVARRYAGVVRRDEPEPSVEDVSVLCADGGTIAAWEVHRLLLLKGHRTDDVRFVESWWPGQVVFEATLAGRRVVRGTVIIDCNFDSRKIEAYAKLRIDEAFESNGYLAVEASLAT